MSVGSHFILGFQGPSVPPWLRHFASQFGLGGVILFDYDCQTKTYENNIQDPAQLRSLCAEIHSLPGKPLIFIDQEGGKVRRLKDGRGFRPLPSAKTLGAMTSDERLPLLTAACEEMTDLGIDFDLAPVADLDINPTSPGLGAAERCVSADPEVVQGLVADFADAARSAGLMLCLKHYPGLGSARVDSHQDLTVVDEPSGDQLGLFYDLASVIPGDAILVSHAIVPRWDPEHPATMSPAALDPLRDRMPDTLLITDDMQMQGLLRARSLAEGCAASLAAGMDMVIIGNNLLRCEPEELMALATSLERRRSSDGAFADSLRLSERRVNARKT